MKKLKLNLTQEVGEILSREELKRVLGGTGSGGSTVGPINGINICTATSGNWDDRLNYCTNDPKRAEAWAGTNGWWCCNCAAAHEHCADKIDTGS